MFAKPYKVKSNNSLKNSEKKHLIQRILDEFPGATEEGAKALVPVKSSCSCMKLVVHSGEAVDVFVCDGAPLLLGARGRLLPTVVALWRLPALLPALTMQAPVLPKIQNGAPLYLPGVCVPSGGAGFPMFPRGAALAAATSDNAAAAAVGLAACASGDMLLKLGGVCLDVLHWTGDQLCRDPKFAKLERPRLAPPSPAATLAELSERLAGQVQQLHIQPGVKEEWPSLGGRPSQPVPQTPQLPQMPQTPLVPQMPQAVPNTPRLLDEPPASAQTDDSWMDGAESSVGSEIPTDMDELLQWTLLSFIKLRAKSVELPLLCSLLYRNYLLPLCPADRTLDVKKSSYKKVGKFLEAMQKEGLLEVREVEKGVDAVVALNTAHPRVRSHAPPTATPDPTPAPATDDDVDYSPPQVRETFAVTAAVAELFAPLNSDPTPAPATDDDEDYSPPQVRETFALTAAVADLFASLQKGATVTAAEVRTTLTDYVKARGLTSTQKGAVTLDAALAGVLHAKEQDNVKWDALMAGVQARMTPCTEMRFADGSARLVRSRLQPVTMQVVTRSGNKKVTLVSNLESFGFVLSELARAWQRGAAAAAGVTRAPGAKADQILLQGDQTYFVARLLIEKYGLPKKFVEGADKALKKKKGT